MRTYILFSILLLSTAAFAQTGKHQLNLGYGYATLDHVRKGLFDVRKTLTLPEPRSPLADAANPVFGVPVADLDLTNRRRTGTVVLAYRYSLLKWLSAGVAIGYEQETHTIQLIDRNNNNVRSETGSFKRNIYTVAAELQPVYKRFPLVTFYGLLGVGNGFITEKAINSKTSASASSSVNETAVQLTPFAVSVGKKLNGHAELGYGYKGILHIGVGYEF